MQPAPFALDLSSTAFDALPDGPRLSYRELFSPHEDLPKPLRRWAAAHGIALRALTRRDRQLGGSSEKHLFGLRDGYAVESVLIRRRDGFTACISSQVGCAFACRFCASGRPG